jgi:uncharacterized protein YrrD
MQRNINSLIGYDMGATDGEIGKVKEFYFEDNTWIIRYLIVKTGSWLFGHEVLISPEAVIKNAWKQEILPLNLTKEQIRSSPDIDTNKPVSRQQEIELYGHYPWQPYWGSGFYAGGLWEASNTSSVIDQKIINSADDKGRIADEDQHLRSTKEITGYNIQGTDGEIGYIKDFIIDDQTWQILYLVVDSNKWFGGKKVLIGVHHIKQVQWHECKVLVDITVDTIKNSETYHEMDLINPEISTTF